MNKLPHGIIERNSHNIYDLLWSPIFYITLIITGVATPMDILMVYIFETIVIGIFHFLKMLWACIVQRLGGGGYFIAIFFLIHYSIFCYGHLFFFYKVIQVIPVSLDDGMWSSLYSYLKSPEVYRPLLLMIFIYSIKSWANYFRTEKPYKAALESFMFLPYPRIFIQQFVVLLPFFIFGFEHTGYAAAIFLVILRTLVEIAFYMYKNNPDAIIDWLVRVREVPDPELAAKEVKEFVKKMNGE